MESLKGKFIKILADHVSISVEDLSPSELSIIDKSFELFQDKLLEIKTLDDEVKRLSIELANLKAMGSANDVRSEYKSTGFCPTCQRDDSEY